MANLGQMNRRAFLRGAGTLLALPLFESLALGKAALETPLTRFCFLYVPNGMSIEHWRPAQLGPLSPTRLPPDPASSFRPPGVHHGGEWPG